MLKEKAALGGTISPAVGKRSDLPDDSAAEPRQFGESVRTGHRGKKPGP